MLSYCEEFDTTGHIINISPTHLMRAFVMLLQNRESDLTARVRRGYSSIGIISKAIEWTWPMMTSEMDRVIVVE
jgi:hypothetical protein